MRAKSLKAIETVLIVLLSLVLILNFPIRTKAAGVSVRLVDMHQESNKDCWIEDEDITDSYGNVYSGNNFVFHASYEPNVVFDLNGEYESFNGTFVCSTNTDSSASISLVFIADGKIIYTLQNYTRQAAPESISLDLTGVGRLEIRANDFADPYSSYGCLVDSIFTKADEAVVYPNNDELKNVVCIDSEDYGFYDNLAVDAFGNVHKDVHSFNTRYEGYALYNLNGEYETFSAAVCADTRVDSGCILTINFYCDDTLVKTVDSITLTSPAVPVEFSVTGVKVLKITTSCVNPYYNPNCWLVDDILTRHMHTATEWVTDTEPTCTVDGTKHQVCTACGENFNEQSIPATGHTSDGVWVETKAATCTVKGEESQHCTVCGEVTETQSTDLIPHIASDDWEYIFEGNCQKALFCTVCGNIVEKQDAADITHTPSDEWVVDVEATCNEKGLQHQECARCGEKLDEEDIPVIEHQFSDWKTVSGDSWHPPIVKEHKCRKCGFKETDEKNFTSPFVYVGIGAAALVVIAVIVILIVVKTKKGKGPKPAKVKKAKNPKQVAYSAPVNDVVPPMNNNVPPMAPLNFGEPMNPAPMAQPPMDSNPVGNAPAMPIEQIDLDATVATRPSAPIDFGNPMNIGMPEPAVNPVMEPAVPVAPSVPASSPLNFDAQAPMAAPISFDAPAPVNPPVTPSANQQSGSMPSNDSSFSAAGDLD